MLFSRLSVCWALFLGSLAADSVWLLLDTTASDLPLASVVCRFRGRGGPSVVSVVLASLQLWSSADSPSLLWPGCLFFGLLCVVLVLSQVSCLSMASWEVPVSAPEVSLPADFRFDPDPLTLIL